MELSRRAEVFRKKVLAKLFPASPPGVPVSSTEDGILPRRPTSDQEAPKSSEASQGCSSLADKDSMILPSRKIYTASLPSEGYVPGMNNEAKNEDSDSDSSDADVPEEKDEGQPKRKRIRRKKQKNVLQNPDQLHRDQAEYRKHERLIEDNLQLQCPDSTNLSRNKKRKMKKKRQKEKRRAAGLLTKPTGIDFTYKPEREEGTGFEDTDKKAGDVLDFLQATQEIYFSEKRSECAESAVGSENIHEIMQCLESHRISSSDIILLHQMKSLVLLQDVERLKYAVEDFQIRSAMPSEHAKTISSLFLYWITDILPAKNGK